MNAQKTRYVESISLEPCPVVQAKLWRRGERETSPKPRGSLNGAQQNRLQIAADNLSYSPDTFKSDFHFAHRSKHLNKSFD